MPLGYDIPSTIKSDYCPFSLNPERRTSHNVSMPSTFTFLTTRMREQDSPIGLLNILPKAFSQGFKEDISNKLLFGPNELEADFGNFDANIGGITLDTFFSCIPKIQIREYMPDVKADLFWILIKSIFSGIGTFLKKTVSKKPWEEIGNFVENMIIGGNPVEMGGSIGNFFKNAEEILDWVHKYLMGNDPSSNIFIDIYGDKYKTASSPQLMKMREFVYDVYYKIQSATTTNIYELPYMPNGDFNLYETHGRSGWMGEGGSQFRLINSPSNAMTGGGVANLFGRLFGMLWKGIKTSLGIEYLGINYMPFWNAKIGSSELPEPVKIVFPLFNDSIESSIINFIFITNILMNNLWIQYGLYQNSPCLYDVKIEGINRYFVCAADMSVSYSGVLRSPPQIFFNELQKYINKNVLDYSSRIFRIRHQIKIPDVYLVSMEFHSLFPQNFNNFLFNYSEYNMNMLEYMNIDRNPRIEGDFFETLKSAVTKFGEQLKAKANEIGKREDAEKVKKMIAKAAENENVSPEALKAHQMELAARKAGEEAEKKRGKPLTSEEKKHLLARLKARDKSIKELKKSGYTQDQIDKNINYNYRDIMELIPEEVKELDKIPIREVKTKNSEFPESQPSLIFR